MLDGVAADAGHAVIRAVHVNGNAGFLAQGAHEGQASLPVGAPSSDKDFDVGLAYGIRLLPHGLHETCVSPARALTRCAALQKLVMVVVMMMASCGSCADAWGSKVQLLRGLMSESEIA